MMSLPTRLIWRFWRRGCLYWLNALIHPKIFTYWQIGKLFLDNLASGSDNACKRSWDF